MKKRPKKKTSLKDIKARQRNWNKFRISGIKENCKNILEYSEINVLEKIRIKSIYSTCELILKDWDREYV